MIRRYCMASAVVMMLAALCSAGTIQGTLSYAGLPLNQTFPGLSHGVAVALNTDTSMWVYGTVDPGTGEFAVDGLSSGTWFVKVLVGPNDLESRITARSGELNAWEYFELAEDETLTVELAALYAFRLTQPYDSLSEWNGPITCPDGPATPDEFTLAWAPVPAAVRYEVWVGRSDCFTRLSTESVPVDNLSAQIQQGTLSNELFISADLRAFDSGGRQISVVPNITYVNGSAEGVYFQRGSGGRTLHPSSVFVAQVAHVPGVAPSFWTSDLILSNPTGSEVTAKLSFTPRNADGLSEYLDTSVILPAGASRVFGDVVASVLGTSGAGSLEISPSILEVSSRIWTPSPAGGSFGQGFPAVHSDAVASLAGPATTLGVGGVNRGDFRSNLALVEVWGEAVGLVVRVLDRNGALVGSTTLDLPPFGNTQLNDVVQRVGGPMELNEGQVTVEVVSGSGRVAAVLSVVDNLSQDPTTLVLEAR